MKYNDYKALIQHNEAMLNILNEVSLKYDKQMIDNIIDSLKVVKQSLHENSVYLKSEDIFIYIDKLLEFLPNTTNSSDIYEAIALAELFADECIQNIEYKIRVLFVAELGGKWDSMASVYYAMKERDDVIVDVVLQPIFREVLLEDGTKRFDLVYKDWLTPLGIEHIPYKEYDIKKIKPDITFISQPYESVTVPMFWPENIAKYSRLVYLSYFAAVTLNSKYSTALISFFKLNPQKYSWRIPCQSETMKKYYEQYASHKGENVVVTGVSKWDYPMSLNKENTPMPEEWKEKLTGRKVFLWNTHFSCGNYTFGIFSDKSIEFLKLFIQNPEIALIWRPHPMTESVLKVGYSEEVWKYYLSLKEMVSTSANMVIDDNPTYDASFVWSDALISDFSTIIDQYLFMNKPVLMMTNDNIETVRTELCTEKELCDYSKIEFADSIEGHKEFIENVCNNKSEIYTDKQNSIIQNYFYLADGKCGERISDVLIDEFKKEAHKPHRITDILLIGSLKDNISCIESLNSINADYYICDMFLTTNERMQHHTFSMDEITCFDYKCIVVTDEKNFDFIKIILLNMYNIPEEKIMNFWKYYNMLIPKMICDKEMVKSNPSEYSGIILGLSHTEVGLLADQFSKPFCNLAVSSQDLYYQYQTLLYCLENYKSKLEHLEYAIIDLYDYNYFNYDASHSKNIVNYWAEFGRFNLLPHNFDKNKFFEQGYDEIMQEINSCWFSDASEYLIKIWHEYLGDVYHFTDYKGFDSRAASTNRMNFITTEHIDAYEYERKTVTKIHEDTINENKQILIDLIKLLKSINPDIKIYTIIIPKYIETEKRDEKYLSKHENYFNEIVEEVKSQYDFTHLDLKKLTDISNNPAYYYDAAHLNHYGAYTVTKMINKFILNEE